MFMKKILLSLAVITIVAVGAIGATRAYFSSTATSTTNTFTAGTLKLNAGGFGTFDFGPLTLAPGQITGEKSITIKNDGTTNLAWFGDLVVGGNKLKEAIYIDSAKMEFLDTHGNVSSVDWPELTDNFITAGRGTGPNSTWYESLANAATPFQVVSLKAFDGNNGMGTAPYEFMGALKPGYSYRLTLKFGMAANAGNEYQADVVGEPVTVSFKADATQVNVAQIQTLNASWAASSLVDWANTQLSHQITH